MTTTTRTAANGSATTSKRVPAQREHGLDRLREDECYHLTGLITDSLDEAGYLVRKIHSKALNRTIDHDGSHGTTALDRDEARTILAEARDCAALALDYLFRAVDALDDQDPPPF
jgi:hypothetical protein